MSLIESDEKFLTDRIKELHYNEGVPRNILENDGFLFMPQHKELREIFENSWFSKNKWKWHPLVRITLEPIENREFMYQRLINLLKKHRRNIDSYFQIKLGETTVNLPNPLADLNKLDIIRTSFFQIYRKIIQELNFETPKITQTGHIKGKINWNQTIRKISDDIPKEFVTSSFKKNYITNENILLVLCAFWLKAESNRLLNIKFINPLSEYNKNLLKNVYNESSNVLKNFPFPEVINESRKYWKFSYDDLKIKYLIKETKIRIKDKKVLNPNYNLLIEWLSDFKNLDLNRIAATDSQNKIIQSIKDIDRVFEAWIYFEFLDYVHSKGLLVNSTHGKKIYFIFEYNDKQITFNYERQFDPGDGHAWAKIHKPDFTATSYDADNEKIIAIFDAKNYSKDSSAIGETMDKMLSYMLNLNSNFGGLIYPFHPQNWDETTEEKREQMMSDIVNKNYSNESNRKRINLKKEFSKKLWIELPDFLKKEFPNSYEIFQDQTKQKTLCKLRMSPINQQNHNEWRDETMEYIFKSITQSI